MLARQQVVAQRVHAVAAAVRAHWLVGLAGVVIVKIIALRVQPPNPRMQRRANGVRSGGVLVFLHAVVSR